MKKALIFLAVLGLTASLGAQSVVDLAKREKERRESLKGRHAVVVKNADLLRVQKLPAVEVSDPDAAVGEAGIGEAGMDEAQDVAPPPNSSNAGREVPPPGSAGPRTRLINLTSSGENLEVQLKAAKDLVDRLTTEMNALRQQYESQDAMVPGYVIQQQIDETYQRLEKAQAEEAKLQAEMEKRGLAKKDSGAADR